ncbi:conserved hypothetical protein [Histoplasma capsulatum var. duboisii H88]|uniref:Aminoglycoside phosphotransferase domain-containing protein n=1 Tax=Ajellomyces capsulatus (strain H88) TaxID=544711 RepID=F0UKV6_AJEC8|nr:conserved hypothetical protein [Histoplasma capsulatum var. duboisii H88]
MSNEMKFARDQLPATSSKNYIPSTAGPFVFTHHDLAPRNILLDKSNHLWLVDWDIAGWYPCYFEYAAMHNFIPEGWTRLARMWWNLFTWIAAGRWESESNELLHVNGERFPRNPCRSSASLDFPEHPSHPLTSYVGFGPPTFIATANGIVQPRQIAFDTQLLTPQGDAASVWIREYGVETPAVPGAVRLSDDGIRQALYAMCCVFKSVTLRLYEIIPVSQAMAKSLVVRHLRDKLPWGDIKVYGEKRGGWGNKLPWGMGGFVAQMRLAACLGG